MKSGKENSKTRRLYIRVNDDEFDRLNRSFNNSTNRSLSEHLRTILLSKPIKVFHRNKSLDDLMIELVILRHELNSIGNNYNQEVKKLHQTDHPKEIQSWLKVTESTRIQIALKIDQLKASIGKISESWLR